MTISAYPQPPLTAASDIEKCLPKYKKNSNFQNFFDNALIAFIIVKQIPVTLLLNKKNITWSLKRIVGYLCNSSFNLHKFRIITL